MRASLTATLLGLLLLIPAHAQRPTDPAARPDHVGPSELMTATQFRHIKPWFAGKLGNWKLATYELDLLASRLNEATRHAPVGVSAEDTARQVASMRNAIDRKDLPAFTRAYSELTNACNGCHRAAGRGFISVQVPAVSPFTDQDFADQVAEGRKLAYTVCGVCHAVQAEHATCDAFFGAELRRAGAPALFHRGNPAPVVDVRASPCRTGPSHAEPAAERQSDRRHRRLFRGAESRAEEKPVDCEGGECGSSPQCVMRVGTVMVCSMARVTPPSSPSRSREWP